MFTLVFYTGVCGVIAALLTVFSTLFRPIHKRGDSKPWFTFVFIWVVVFSVPYAYTEALTKLYGPKMKAAIEEAYEASNIQGPMHYYRIIGYRSDKEATAYIIGSESESWGGTDRPVVSVHLVDENGTWKAESYKIVSCDRLNKDGYTFPPYW